MSTPSVDGQWSAALRAEAVEKLRKHFKEVPADTNKQIEGWNGLWKTKLTPWDRGRPNPAFAEALEVRPEFTGAPFRDAECKTRKKALVPGCGRGVDVLLLASFGYDAYGVDSSADAVEGAKKLQNEEGEGPNYPLKTTDAGRGSANFLVANFFEDDIGTLTHTPGESAGYDLIYDYRFLCALPPDLRPRWAERMSELLAPKGVLVCLEYPLNKPPSKGGPPYGLSSKLYGQLFSSPGAPVKYDEDGYALQIENLGDHENALVMIDRWTPERSFADPGSEIFERLSSWRHP